MRARLSAQREGGATVTHSDLTVMSCRKVKTLLQSSEMVANVLVVACFFLPVFFFFFSYDSKPPLLLS